MKTVLLSFALTLAVSLGFSSIGLAQLPGNFAVSNQQSVTLGEVTINAPNGAYYGTVPGNATDTVVMTSDTTATSVTINGQTVPQGIKAVVTLATGKQVDVLWPAQNIIVVIDEGELSSIESSQPIKLL